MGANTPEYRTFIACTSKLTSALKAHLIALSGDLLSGGFISQENYERLNMESWEPGRRASELVSIVRTRIDLNQQNFQKFIDILLKKPSLHRDILTILDDTYKSNGKSLTHKSTPECASVLYWMYINNYHSAPQAEGSCG